MKLTTDRDTLADAASWVARTLPQRPAVPVLAGMRLHAGDGALTVSAFDYDASAQATVNADAGEPGTVLTSGRLFAEVVKSLPPRPVTIASDGAHVTLECGSARFTLNQIPDEEYPSLPGMPAVAGTVGADAFAAAVAQVAVAAGRDDTLPALTGVRAEISEAALTLIATDRYRLAVRELTWQPTQKDTEAAILVPARVLTDAVKAMTGGTEVTIGLGGGEPGSAAPEGILGLSGAGRQMTTRLLGGEYPRWQPLMPSEFSATAELEAGPFAEAVKRVALVAERNTPIRLAFTDGRVTLEAGAGGESEATEAMDAAYDGEEMRIAFNPGYLLDGITACSSGVARMSFTTPVRPAVITGPAADGETPGYRYLIMPIRGNG